MDEVIIILSEDEDLDDASVLLVEEQEKGERWGGVH